MKFDVKTQGKKMEVALEGRMDSATAPGFEKEIFQKLDGVLSLFWTLPILRIFPVPD